MDNIAAQHLELTNLANTQGSNMIYDSNGTVIGMKERI
jgi:hypothetical protein